MSPRNKNKFVKVNTNLIKIINLSCNLSSPDSPWSLIGQSYSDLTFLIDGVKHQYHQAILAQHSSLLRDMFSMAKCCKCFGFECMHEAREIIITLDNVKEEVFKVAMEIVYDGCGKVPNDVEEFKSVVSMLCLDSLFIRDTKDQNGNKGKADKSEDAGGLVETRHVEANHDPETDFDSHFLTSDVGEIAELKLCNMLSDTIDTFEDDNFSVTVQEMNSDTISDKIPTDQNLLLLDEDETSTVNNIICDSEGIKMDDSDTDIYDYNYEDGDEEMEVASEEEVVSDEEFSDGSDEHSSIENDNEANDESHNEIGKVIVQNTFKDIDDARTPDNISDDEDIIEINVVKNDEQSQQESFSIRNHILKGQNHSTDLNKSSARNLLEKLDGNKLSIIVNKTEDDDKILMEDNHENQLEDTLSEFTNLLRRKNSKVEQDLDLSRKDHEETSMSRTEVEKKDSVERIVYHCPFENCSYSNKRAVDFTTHIGAKHYRTKIQELYPNFIHKHCTQCEKTFSVTSNYYSHMAKHENFPFMNKADVSSVGRLEIVEESKPLKPKEEDNSNDSHYGSHLLETFTAKCLKESSESANKSLGAAVTDDDDDDIIEISPPKRKSPYLSASDFKIPRGLFHLNKST
eukprot:GFUD01019958.1.p1 GENE.GFUD01019958.1~~GFUD01019958.1.p1  ORF type:complete len:629 (+),score=183.81 GFUD01019958.1:175-2061(+)